MASVFRKGGKGPFLVAYRDHNGRRRTVRTKFKVESDARQFAALKELEAEKVRRKILDPKDLEIAHQRRRPLQEHFKEYLAHQRHSSSSKLSQKILRSQLDRLAAAINATVLADILDPNAVDRFLQAQRSRPVSRDGQQQSESRRGVR